MRASSYTPWLKPVPARHRALPPTPGTVSHSLARRREPSHPYGRRPPVTTNADFPADLTHHRLEQQTATPRTPRPASTTSTTHKTCAIPHRPSPSTERHPNLHGLCRREASGGSDIRPRSRMGRISDPWGRNSDPHSGPDLQKRGPIFPLSTNSSLSCTAAAGQPAAGPP